MSEIDAVVLAGGRSRRMGRDKALLPFGGYETLAEYQFRRLEKIFPRIYISAKTNKFPFEAPLILDQSDEYSPMVALASVLAQSQASSLFLLGVDMPFVSSRLIKSLIEKLWTHPHALIVAARTPAGPEPLCALYRRDLLPEVEILLSRGLHRLQTLYEAVPTHYLDVENPEELSNLNRPQDYKRAQKIGELFPKGNR